MKMRLQFRMWHLLLLMFVVAAVIWALTQYGMERAIVHLEAYQVVEAFGGEQCDLHMQFRVDKPEAFPLAGQSVDYAIFRAPASLVRTDIAEGSDVVFRYRKRGLWIGFGGRTLWERQAVPLMERFRNEIFKIPTDRPLNKHEERAVGEFSKAFLTTADSNE